MVNQSSIENVGKTDQLISFCEPAVILHVLDDIQY